MRTLVVVAAHELIEFRLLLEQIARGRLGGFLLEREMHALVAAVLLGMARPYALDLNT